MEEHAIIRFIKYMSDFGGLLAFVGALVILLFGEKLKAKLTSIVSGELQERKAALDRDLEEYRVRLLTDVERIKGKAAISTAVALKLAHHRLDKLTDYFVTNEGVLAEVSTLLMYRTDNTFAECLKHLKKTTLAREVLAPFLKPEQSLLMLKSSQMNHMLVAKYVDVNHPVLTVNAPEYLEALQALVAAQNMIRTEIEELTKL